MHKSGKDKMSNNVTDATDGDEAVDDAAITSLDTGVADCRQSSRWRVVLCGLRMLVHTV